MLHYQIVTAQPKPQNTALVLHGILDSGRAWRTIAWRVVARSPQWRVVLLDLRGHGKSHDAPPPHTVDACVADLAELTACLGSQPRVIIGHSFGGRVALRAALLHPEAYDAAVVLDAPPGPREPADPTERAPLDRLIATLRAVPMPCSDRGLVAGRLVAAGWTPQVASWLTTNLQPGVGELVWRFDLEVAALLLGSCLKDGPVKTPRKSASRARKDAVRRMSGMGRS